MRAAVKYDSPLDSILVNNGIYTHTTDFPYDL